MPASHYEPIALMEACLETEDDLISPTILSVLANKRKVDLKQCRHIKVDINLSARYATVFDV